MRFVFLLLLTLTAAFLRAQTPAVQQLLAGKSPQQQVILLDSVAKAIRNSDYGNSVALSKNAIALAAKNKLYKSQITCIMNLYKTYRYKVVHDSALICIDSARAVAVRNSINDQLAYITDSEGLIYMRKSDYVKAANCFYKAIDYAEKQNNSSGIRDGFNHLGIVAFYRHDYKSSVAFYRRSLTYINPEKDSRYYVSTMDNIGLCYANQKMLDSAMYFQRLAAQKAPLLNDSNFMAEVYINYASTLLLLNKFTEAQPYIDTAYVIHNALNNEYGQILANTYRARLLIKTGKPREAIPFAEKAYSIAVRLDIPEQIRESASTLTDAYSGVGDYKKAVEYYEIMTEVMERISASENAKAINELSAQYESEKQQQKIEILTRDTQLKEERISADKKLKFFYGAIALLFLGLSGIFIYRFQEKKKANRLLEEKSTAIALQKQQIETQKQELEQRNKEVTESIQYAQRIQSSVLPSAQLIQQFFPENFIYFKPKDIVSGDFYWFSEKVISAGDIEKRFLYFAVADCTGHGVPGAMMAMLGSSLLNRIVSDQELLLPGVVLSQLHTQIVKAMNESTQRRDSNDGMDIALLLIDLQDKKLWYAGAGRSLVYKQDGDQLTTIRHNKNSIGDESDSRKINFDTHELSFTKPLQLYLFTDGIADQFGGPRGKKFMAKQLHDTLDQLTALPFTQQFAHFANVFENWKGNNDQTDDVTLAGFYLR
jgi:serine phosphatase RsbU (regulator of sigma subunit)